MLQNTISFSDFLKEHKGSLSISNPNNLSDWLSICEILFQNKFQWIENDSYSFNPESNQKPLLDKMNKGLNSILERSQLIESLTRDKLNPQDNSVTQDILNNQINTSTQELNQTNVIELKNIQEEFNNSIHYYCWKKVLLSEAYFKLNLYIAPGLIWIEKDCHYSSGLEESYIKNFKDLISLKDSYIELLLLLPDCYYGIHYFAKHLNLTKEDLHKFIPSYWLGIYKNLEQRGFELEQSHQIEEYCLSECKYTKNYVRELPSEYLFDEEDIYIQINFSPKNKTIELSMYSDGTPKFNQTFCNEIDFYTYLALCDEG